MSSRPDLMFLESTDSAGFTAAGITSFREVSPSAIVRELLQNSLDAVHPDQDSRAIVRFRLGEIRTSEIPGIESYQRAFGRAVKLRRKETGSNQLPTQEQSIVDQIQKALSKSTQDLLTVIDNGIGLDRTTMKAILSDGISHKPDGASGAFGNGHLSVFPTSDLRYVLYGGVNEGKWISSGHAILASHDEDANDEIGRSANGYYLTDHKGRHHRYPDRSATPPIVAKVLQEITGTTAHGTAVIIPAFNHFLDHDKVFDAIRRAAACSFFSAIHDKKLEVVIEDKRKGNGKIQDHVINSDNLQSTLQDFEGEKQNKNFLSGFKANSAYATIKKGTVHEVTVLDGHIRLHLLQPAPSESTRVNLCRNGMWITNSDGKGIPGFSFGDRETFEAVILVSSGEAPRFHDLIRKAEGPLHNRLDTKTLGNDRRELLNAFKVIKEWLRANVTKITSEAFSPSDFLSFPNDSDGAGGSQKPGYCFQGTLTPIWRRSSSARHNVDAQGGTQEHSQGKGKGTGRRKKSTRVGSRQRPVLPAHFTMVATPQGPKKRKIVISCTENSENLELRLFVNENTDPTTDRIWEDEIVAIKTARINGKPVTKEDIIRGKHPALRLGDLKAGTKTEVVVEYMFDDMGRDRAGEHTATSLRVEIGKIPEKVPAT